MTMTMTTDLAEVVVSRQLIGATHFVSPSTNELVPLTHLLKLYLAILIQEMPDDGIFPYSRLQVADILGSNIVTISKMEALLEQHWIIETDMLRLPGHKANTACIVWLNSKIDLVC